MELKNAELIRSEDLPKEIREENSLPDTGMIIIETTNPELKQNFKTIGTDGLRGYMLSLGNFKDIELPGLDSA